MSHELNLARKGLIKIWSFSQTVKSCCTQFTIWLAPRNPHIQCSHTTLIIKKLLSERTAFQGNFFSPISIAKLYWIRSKKWIRFSIVWTRASLSIALRYFPFSGMCECIYFESPYSPYFSVWILLTFTLAIFSNCTSTLSTKRSIIGDDIKNVLNIS